LQWPEKQQAPKKPEQDPPGRVSGDFSKQYLDKISIGMKGKKYPARECTVCVTCKKHGETRYICILCIALLQKGYCFEEHHLIRNCQTL